MDLKHFEKNKNPKNVGVRLLIAFILTLIVFFVMVICYNKLTNNEKYISVIISTKNIEQGTLIEEKQINSYFKEKKVPESLVPADYINIDDLDGVIINCDLSQNSIVTNKMIQSKDSILAKMKEPVSVGVQVDEVFGSINGSIRTGDVVDLTIVSDEDITVIKNVYVATSRDSSGTEIAKDKTSLIATNFDIYIERELEGWLNRKMANGQIYFTKSDSPDYEEVFKIEMEDIRENFDFEGDLNNDIKNEDNDLTEDNNYGEYQ